MKTNTACQRPGCHKMVEPRCPVLEILRRAIKEIEQQHRPATTKKTTPRKEYLHHG